MAARRPRHRRGLALAGLAAALSAAPAAAGVDVYRITGQTYTRVPVTWRVLEHDLVINPRTLEGVPETSVRPHAADPLTHEIRLARPGERPDCEAYQSVAIWTADAELPAADGYAIVFPYDVRSWDSYSESGPPLVVGAPCIVGEPGGGDGGGWCSVGYYDFISVNINQVARYVDLVNGGFGELTDPLMTLNPNGSPVIDGGGERLPGLTWGFGGACYFEFPEQILEVARGRVALVYRAGPAQPYFLSFSLDTRTSPTNDGLLISWAVFGDERLCPADFNADGAVSASDAFAFQTALDAGDLTADFNKDGAVDAADSEAFDAAYQTPCAAACRASRTDWNRDGAADGPDRQAFLEDWQAGAPRADLNGDGAVDARDRRLFLNLHGRGVCVCAADLNADERTDELDRAVFEQLRASLAPGADLDGDGEITDSDREVFERLLARSCGSCRVDLNADGRADQTDVFLFLRAWFANAPSADFDGQNGIQIADIFAFLRSWFAGC